MSLKLIIIHRKLHFFNVQHTDISVLYIVYCVEGPYISSFKWNSHQVHTPRNTRYTEQEQERIIKFLSCQKEKQINKIKKERKSRHFNNNIKIFSGKSHRIFWNIKKIELHYLLYAKCDVQYNTCKKTALCWQMHIQSKSIST